MSWVEPIRDALCGGLRCIGAFFFLVGTLGLLRFPDYYFPHHATTKCDTVGGRSILLAARGPARPRA